MKFWSMFKKRKSTSHIQPQNAVGTRTLPSNTRVKIEVGDPFLQGEVTPEIIRYAKDNFERGRLREIQSLFDRLYKNDDNLASDTDVRIEASKTAQYTLPDNLSQTQKDYFSRFLNKHLPVLIEQFMDYKLCGLVFRQILFEQTQSGIWNVIGFEEYSGLDLRYENGDVLLYQDDKPKPINEAKFIAKYNKYPVYESLLKYYAFTSFALNNWASFMETYGKPIRIGKYKAGTSADEQNKLWQMVRSLGTDLAAMISENTLIEFVEHKSLSSSSALYNDLLSFCRNSVTKRILGQVLTTNSQESGSYAQAKVHELVRQDLLSADLREASIYIGEVCTHLNRLFFADDEIEIKLHIPEKINLTERINIDTQLSYIVKIDPEYFYETYGVPRGTGTMDRVQRQEPTPHTFMVGTSTAGCRCYSPETDIATAPLNLVFNYKIKSVNFATLAKIYTDYMSTLQSFDDILNAPFPAELYMEFGHQLSQAILEAYSIFGMEDFNGRLPQNIFEIDWSTPDIEALNAFRAEAFEVAGVTCAETLSMLKDAAATALEKGYSFHWFQQHVKLQGFEPQNPYHLRTNFETAINNAYLAREWNELQKVKELFPYLQYTCILDNRVRDEHRVMHGLVRHIDDEFWHEYYPPNGWNCRCGVTPLSREDGENSPGIEWGMPPLVRVNENFRKNTARERSIWGNWLTDAKITKNEQSATSLGLENWKNLKTAELPELFKNMDNLSIEELRKVAQDFLNNRTVIDKNGFPVVLKESKAFKLKEDKLTDARRRVEHLPCIDDTLISPTEVWIDKKGHRIRYLKKYEKDVLVLVDFTDGEFEYFNILLNTDTKYIEKQRIGYYVVFAK